ncbi:MAG: polysaccharide deacetylase family protein [Bacteroidetes bacterium]|nr:polysaccharide deacetylase family protein [Bacteroidota bacterium]
MYSVSPPYLLTVASSRSLIWKVPEAAGKIFLTFDDGPIPEVTIPVLDILKSWNAKASFFCVGENAEKNQDILQRITQEGHTLGNHTFNHLNGWKTPSDEYIRNVDRCAEVFQSAFFRPPYGKITPVEIVKLRATYNIVLWSVLSRDFDRNTGQKQCLENATSKCTDGSIVVFHDSVKASKNMLYALPRFLEAMTEKGFSFHSLHSAIKTKMMSENTIRN